MSKTPRVIFVSLFAPEADGHGGNHRSYQIWHDCQRAFGEDHVRVLSFNTWQQEYVAGGLPGKRRSRSLRFWRLASFVRDSLVNPTRVAGSFRWVMSIHHPAFLAAYREIVASMSGQVVCVLEDARFLTILRENRRAGIGSLLVPQNIQSFHDAGWTDASDWRNRVRAGNFLHEFRAFALARRTLLISKVEAGLVGGIGLPAAYYPYRPAGEIAAHCDEIRSRRQRHFAPGRNATPEKFSLLFIGSAGQPSTIASVEWLLDNVAREPLPGHVELQIAGNGTDRLAAGRRLPANVSVLGRVSDEQLKDLLVQARGVLIPAFQGMGALTRLSEMHRCGLPLLVSRHVMYAVDPMPGVIALDEHWPAWVAAIDTLVTCLPMFEVRIDEDDSGVESLRSWVQEAAAQP